MKIQLLLILLLATTNIFAQESKDTELMKAISEMNAAKVQNLVAEGASLSSEKVTTFVMLLIQKAAFSDNLETTEKMLSRFEFFVRQGGDVNIRVKTLDLEDEKISITDTPLTYISKIENRCPESLLVTIKKLLDLGADIHAKRITIYPSGPIYQTSMELNRYNGIACHKKIKDILENYAGTLPQ